MQAPSSHDSRRRERIAENVYRRTTSRGEVVYETSFRDVDGRQRRRRLDARSERAAIKEARGLLAGRDAGDRVVPADATLSEFTAGEYVPLLESLAAAGRRSERNVEHEKQRLRDHVEPTLGELPLATIDGTDVALMLRTLRKAGYSESTLHNALTSVRAIYRLARSRRLVKASPVDELDASERPRRKTGGHGRRLDERELDLLVRHAPDGYRTAVAIVAYTGMRLSEACALRWQDVDLVDLELHVSGQLTYATRTRPARIVPRKGDAAAFEALIFPALERVLVDRLAAEQQAGRGRDDDFVLATRTGRPQAQKNLADAVREAAASAGLPYVTPHDLRRSYCSLAARRGVDPVQAARMTGHALDTWMRHYASDYGKPQRDEARRRMLDAGFGALESELAEPGEEA
jgi:integrase